MFGPDLIENMYSALKRHAVMLSVPFKLTKTEHYELCTKPCSVCGAKAGKYSGAPYQTLVRLDETKGISKHTMKPYCFACFGKRYTRWLNPIEGANQKLLDTMQKVEAIKDKEGR